MKCLTLWRPWPWVIFHAKKSAETGHGRKLVENRDWPPPKSAMGYALALHAGKHWDREGAAFIQRTLGLTGLPPEAWEEGIIGTTKIVGVALRANDCPPDQRVWFFGSHGWLLDESSTVALPKPIAIKGAQGLWTLPPAVSAEVEKGMPQLEVICPVHHVAIVSPGGACAVCVMEDPPPSSSQIRTLPRVEASPFGPDLGHVGGDLPPLMPDEIAELAQGLEAPPPEPKIAVDRRLPESRLRGRERDREDARRTQEDEAHERMGRILGFDEEGEP
jgi:hypothetical protein